MGYRENPENAEIDSFYASLGELNHAYNRVIPAPEPFESLAPFFQRGIAANVLPYLVLEAQKARELAVSHRNFRVGAAALVLYWRDGMEYQRYIHGANLKPWASDEKPESSDEINVHAEHVMMHDIEKYMYPGDKISVPAVVVIGDYQHDQQSGQQTRTLHPCGVCREDFAKFELPSFAETLFITARDSLQTFEWFTLAQLTALHQGREEELAHAEFDHPLAIFKPFSSSVPRNIDDEEEERDVDLFNDAAVLPIMRGGQ